MGWFWCLRAPGICCFCLLCSFDFTLFVGFLFPSREVLALSVFPSFGDETYFRSTDVIFQLSRHLVPRSMFHMLSLHFHTSACFSNRWTVATECLSPDPKSLEQFPKLHNGHYHKIQHHQAGLPFLVPEKKKSINLQLPYVLQIPSLILATEYAFSSFHIALPFDKILRKDILVLPPRETCNGKELYDRPRQSSGKTFTQHITFHSFVTFAFTILNKFSSCIAVCLFLHSAFKWGWVVSNWFMD
jgi:hypothetical protein